MGTGPGVKAALTTGTMTMVFQKRALEKFMLLSPSLSVVAVLWAVDVKVYQQNMDESIDSWMG